MKKIDNSRIEYAALNQPNISPLSEGTIENRSEAVIDDGEFIRSHWQKRIIKHQPPIVQSPSELLRTMEDLKLLDKGKKSLTTLT
ncbi:hypothetical protein [Prevotella pallens]